MIKVNGTILDDIIKVKSIKIIEPIKKLIKNNVLSYWTYREIEGQIIINASIEGENDAIIDKKLDELIGCLGSGIVQIDNKNYKVNLIMNVGSNIDTRNFYIAFLFKEENVGDGIMPLAVKDVRATIVGKNVTLNFTKGIDSLKTKVICDGKEVITEENKVELAMNNDNTLYEAELYSISSTENLGNKVSISFKTDRASIIPSEPQDVKVSSIKGKKVNVNFKKGLDVFKTQIDINGVIYESYNESLDVILPEYNKEYDVKLKSISIDGNESKYTEILKVITGSKLIPKAPIVNEVIINEDVITINFTKGEEAYETEFIIDGYTHITTDTTIQATIGAYEKEFTYKARSISECDEVSEYTIEAKAVTGRKVIIPEKPFEVGITSIIGKVVKIIFAKGSNAEKTEAMLGNILVVSDTNEIEIVAPSFETSYKLKLRSKSSTLDVSEWTEEIDVLTKVEPIKPTNPTMGTIEVNGRAIKINFIKAAESKYTELQINDDVYITESESFEFTVLETNKEYIGKLRAISDGYGYGDFIEVKFISEEAVSSAKLLDYDESYSPLQIENINCNAKGFMNEVDIDLKMLKDNKTNRYSISNSVIDGSIQ